MIKSPLGFPGLLAVPFLGMSLEKSFYDTAMSLQGVCPNKPPKYHTLNDQGQSTQGFPGGGFNLPSLSLVPVKHIKDYFS